MKQAGNGTNHRSDTMESLSPSPQPATVSTSSTESATPNDRQGSWASEETLPSHLEVQHLDRLPAQNSKPRRSPESRADNQETTSTDLVAVGDRWRKHIPSLTQVICTIVGVLIGVVSTYMTVRPAKDSLLLEKWTARKDYQDYCKMSRVRSVHWTLR